MFMIGAVSAALLTSAGAVDAKPTSHSVYVDGKQVSYTPTGTYYIENERGESFFNNSLNEGARYYISWLNHGEYLFHTVPTNAQGEYDVEECKKLGKQPASHGCIRLSVPDAIWLYNNLPVGTKVVINDK